MHCVITLGIPCTVCYYSGHPLHCVNTLGIRCTIWSLWASCALCVITLGIPCTVCDHCGHRVHCVWTLWVSDALCVITVCDHFGTSGALCVITLGIWCTVCDHFGHPVHCVWSLWASDALGVITLGNPCTVCDQFGHPVPGPTECFGSWSQAQFFWTQIIDINWFREFLRFFWGGGALSFFLSFFLFLFLFFNFFFNLQSFLLYNLHMLSCAKKSLILYKHFYWLQFMVGKLNQTWA